MASAGGMAKRPVSITARSTPPAMWRTPNTSRSAPVIMSMPTRPTATPIIAEARPLAGAPASSSDTLVRPKIATQKYSIGPNFRASVTSGGAMIISANALMIEPAVEETSAMCSAYLARPAWASG